LVVCTANICRSPAGEVFLANALKGKSVQVRSAGTLAIDNHYVHPVIEEFMVERGFSQISQHRSTALMPSSLANYGLILCMEQDHLDWIKRAQPTATAKAKLLGHWDGQRGCMIPSMVQERGIKKHSILLKPTVTNGQKKSPLWGYALK